MRLGLKAVALAAQSIGVTEDPIGSNWGKWVKFYLWAVGLFTPAPWCAAFVYFKIRQAAQELNVPFDWPRTGYCPTIDAWAQKNNRFSPRPFDGCVFILYVNGRARHTGFVNHALANQAVETVEGNTNSTGGPEGYEVLAHTRPVNSTLKFIRIEP